MQPYRHGLLRRPTTLLAIGLATTFVVALSGALSAQRSAIPSKPDDALIVHVLNRIGFGPAPGDVDRVREMGLARYIEDQLHPERIANEALKARLNEFETLELSNGALAERYFVPAQQAQRQAQQQAPPQRPPTTDPTMMAPPPQQPRVAPELQMARQMGAMPQQELMQAKLLRAALSEAQLEEVLVDFWFNHFNVFLGKGQVRQYITVYERDAIRPHVFGSFRKLLGETAHSPAMLFYLDNFQSQSANPMMMDPEIERRLSDPRLTPQQRAQLLMRQRQQPLRPNQQRRGLNENYARELMELHTLGVDGGYTQQDVQEVARAFTGWTIDRPQQGGAFVFRPQMHDTSPKTILGVTFPAGGSKDEGDRVLDMLARHPSTARHIAFKLAQRFVADEPPKALVDRAAQVFLDTKGNLRDVTRTIITSPEFFSKDAYRAKVKTPLEFVVSAVRATGTTVMSAQPLVQALQVLGMPVYGCEPPTGYSMTADAWVNTGALLNRMNFALSLVGDGGRGMAGGGRGRGPNAGAPPPQNAGRRGQPPGRAGAPGRPDRAQQQLARAPLQVNVAALAPDTSEGTLDKLVNSFLAGEASAATVQTIARATSPQQMIALTLGSPEFQRR
jgi:uncharacterized protein (DUF1800 family)